jgi:hypothetical protein
MSTTVTSNEQNIDIIVNNDVIDINVTTSVVDVNTTTEIINIEAAGTYPLPATVYSVFGRTGNILALNGDYNTSLVTENTNLYFTNARARAAISLTTTGTSGAATYNSTTGVLNVPEYQGGVTSFNTRTGAITLLSADVTGALGFTPYNATNPAGYISGITSGMVTTALGYTPVTNARTLTINGTTYDLTADRSWTIAAGSGTVTSVGLSAPTGFSVTNSPITTSGTLALGFSAGYSLPTDASQATWNTAYNRSLLSASVTGTTTKTLTLNQQDGGTITASWTDINTDAVTSVFGRTGAVVATEGDYNLTQLGDVTITTPSNGQVLKYNGTTWVNGTDTDTGLTSVGLSMPSAFTVTNSPLTANGTLSVTGAGIASQYVRGDGTLANFPTSGGGGSSVAYYFNSSVSQGTLGGVAYRELSKVPIIGAGTDITIATNGYIANYITDAGDPALLEIPAGNWIFEMYFSASFGGGTPSFYVELYKYNGTTFTLISSSSAAPERITNGTAIDLYTTALAVPLTALTITDRLAIRVYVTNSGRTITLHTENSHLCEVITTFTTGLTALNGLTAQVQFLGTGTSGTDFNIASSVATHTFNLPIASASNTGKLSSSDWSVFNNKQTALSGTGFVKISGTTISYDNSTYYLASNPSAFIALTALSAGTGINYNNTTGVITNSAPDQTVSLTASTGISVSGTYPSFTIASTITQYTDALARASISLTTTGTSGAATYDNTTGVLNIPQYTGGGGGGMAIGGSITSATAGSVLFAGASGVLAQDNANFFWDDTNDRLNIGSSTTGYFGSSLFVSQKSTNYAFEIKTTSAKTSTTLNKFMALSSSDATSPQYLEIGIVGAATNSNRYFSFQTSEFLIADSGNIVFQPRGGNVGIGATTIGSKLQVNGNAAIGYSASTAAPTNGLIVNGNIENANSGSVGIRLTTNVDATSGGTLNIFSLGSAKYAGANLFNSASGLAGSFQYADTSVNETNLRDSFVLGARTTNGKLNFVRGASATLMATFDASGNFGINTQTIGSRVQVNGNAAIGYSTSTAAPTNGLAVAGQSTFANSVSITCTGSQVPITLTAASAANNTVILKHAGNYNAIQINNNAGTPVEVGVIGWGNSGAFTELQNSFYFLANTSNVPTASTRFVRYNGTSFFVDGMFNSSGNFLIGTTTNVASAKMQISSTTQGFLPPRMTTTQKNAITTPAAGLIVYDTTLNKLCVFTTAWETITSL